MEPPENSGRFISFYARKLEHLRDCELLIKYHHSTTIQYRGQTVTALISEYVEGVLLEELIAAGRGKRLPEHEALSILHTLSSGLEKIHARRDYHGDLHDRNIMVRRRGVFFDLKLVDLYNLGRPSAANIREDVIDSVRLLCDMLGGQRHCASHRPEIKAICCGLRGR